jgi:hypothetical protein
MPAVKLLWTRSSKLQFDALRQRAVAAGKITELSQAHNEMVTILRDLDQALEKGEALYYTRRPGGVVRLWIHNFISVTYVVFRIEQVAWITKYQPVPASWPE